MRLTMTGRLLYAIRRGEAYDGLQEFRAPVVYGKSELLYDECGLALVAVGSMVKTAAAGAGDAQGHRLQLYARERDAL